jgi:dihydroorotase
VGLDRVDVLEMARPDDWHLHLRDGAMLERVLPHTARVFRRAIVMPNLTSPITTLARARAYRSRVLAALPDGLDFEPLMTLYLTDSMTPDEIERAADTQEVAAVKFYPKGATTNSDAGVEGLEGLGPVLEALERFDLPLLVHGESTASDCDVFDRERVFLERTLVPLIERHPALRVVFEHITTAEAAAFVTESSVRVAATITPQHLLMNRNAIFEGGLRPHHYCLPVLKRESDREALVAAATSGDPSFFLGTDSAPHERGRKEAECGCAGIYSAPVAIEAYAEALERADALDRLEGFASHFGADFYGRPRNTDRIRLERVGWSVPEFDRNDRPGAAPTQNADALRIFWAGDRLQFRRVEES